MNANVNANAVNNGKAPTPDRGHVEQVLIANNGMAGTKAILSMRQWCYLELGDEKAVEFVAMATPEVRAQLNYLAIVWRPYSLGLSVNPQYR